MKAILEFKSDRLPVSIEYIKDHFALSESDKEVRQLLQIAVEHVELQNGISLQPKTWKIIHDNSYIVLNFGPVVKLLSVKNNQGADIKPISVKRAHDNLVLQMPEGDKLYHIRYEAGYDENTLPDCLKHTIVEKFWELYSSGMKVANENNFDSRIKRSDYNRSSMNEKYVYKF